MSVFEEIQGGKAYDIREPEYQKEVHGEIRRCDHICWKIRKTDPLEMKTIIGTGSVVTKDIPDNSIAVGNPAKVIREI